MESEHSTGVRELNARPGGTTADPQYLLVGCNVTRVVTVDGKVVGRTDEILELPPGQHTVSLLTPPENFRPKYRRITLDNASPDKPLVIRFETR
jgi:hypothetical protein